MKRNAISVVALPIILICFATNSFGGQIVIDQNWSFNGIGGVWDFGATTQGTIIDVTIAGKLSAIQMYISIDYFPPAHPLPATDLHWAIRPVEDGLPSPITTAPIAEGLIAGSEFGYSPALISFDVSAFDLYFASGSQFALTLTGGAGADFEWWSYRGYGVPVGREFQFNGVGWQMLTPSPSNPPIGGGYTTFIEIIPEPGNLSLMFVALVLFVGRCIFLNRQLL